MRPLIVLLPLALSAPLILTACDKPKPTAPQGEAAQAPAPAPPPTQDTGKVETAGRGRDMPATPFLAPDGGPATLTQFRGKPLMVNLWATWCAPCIAEMPALDALAAREQARFRVVVVSQDLAGKREVDPFFAKHKFTTLQPYLDKQNVLMTALKTETLPTTVFYDAKGKERWRVTGAMDWNGERAKTLIEGAL